MSYGEVEFTLIGGSLDAKAKGDIDREKTVEYFFWTLLERILPLRVKRRLLTKVHAY